MGATVPPGAAGRVGGVRGGQPAVRGGPLPSCAAGGPGAAGTGRGRPTSLALTVIGDLYDGEKQVKLFSLMNSLVTITMAGAPLLRAWLSEAWGWWANFLLILAGSLAGTAGIWLILPESHPP